MTLEQCIGEEGFVFPEEIEWYTPIDEVIAWLPLSETMTPGNEAFDARKYTELPDNSQVTLTPDILYRIADIEDDLRLTLEFNANKEFYGCWLSSDLLPVTDMGDEEKNIRVRQLLAMLDALSNGGELLVEQPAGDPAELTFAYFEGGGRLRAFVAADDGTFSQISAGIVQGNWLCSIGIGQTADWPAAGGIIAGLRG